MLIVLIYKSVRGFSSLKIKWLSYNKNCLLKSLSAKIGIRRIIKIVNQTKEKEAPDSSFALIRALQCCISFFSRESNSSIPDVDGFH